MYKRQVPECFEKYANEIRDGLKAAGPVDGVLLALHGAMAAANAVRPEAEIVRRARQAVGKDCLLYTSIKTDLSCFTEGGYYLGEEVIEKLQGTRTPIGGFIDFAKKTGNEVVPTVAASASPSGIVTKEAYETLKTQLIDGIKKAGKVDGVLLALHGAMVVDGTPDAEGDILRSVREVVGEKVPVVSTLDFHANVTDAMVNYSDGLFGRCV